MTCYESYSFVTHNTATTAVARYTQDAEPQIATVPYSGHNVCMHSCNWREFNLLARYYVLVGAQPLERGSCQAVVMV